MAKQRPSVSPILIVDFEPFYWKNGLVWVPYYSANGTRFEHCLSPSTTFKGVESALAVLNTGNVIPIAAHAIRNATKALRGH